LIGCETANGCAAGIDGYDVAGGINGAGVQIGIATEG
jgi:hypothetical protein